MVANEKDKPASSLVERTDKSAKVAVRNSRSPNADCSNCASVSQNESNQDRCLSSEAVPASLEFVITSRDPKFNKGLMKAMSGSDHLIGTHGLKSIFERVYHTDTEAVAVVKHGCEKSAKSRLRRALHSRIPFAKEVGLKMFLRRAFAESEREPSNALKHCGPRRTQSSARSSIAQKRCEGEQNSKSFAKHKVKEVNNNDREKDCSVSSK